MRYGERSEAVRQMQLRLMERGHKLQRWGADGTLGAESWAALEDCSRAELGTWSPEVPSDVLAVLQTAPPAPDVPVAPWVEVTNGSLSGEPHVLIRDLRSKQSNPAPKSKVQNGLTVSRAPATITGITLHQTATPYGVSARQVAAAGGEAEALANRALGVACHAMAFRRSDVGVVWTNPLTSYVWHGNGQNRTCVGVEIVGRYAGVEGKAGTTWGGEPQVLTPDTIAAARAALRLVVTEGRALGCPLTHLYAHRQSSRSRKADPGSAIWQQVALWGVSELGLQTDCARTWGDGTPVPVEWDAVNGVGSY